MWLLPDFHFIDRPWNWLMQWLPDVSRPVFQAGTFEWKDWVSVLIAVAGLWIAFEARALNNQLRKQELAWISSKVRKRTR